MRAVAAVGEALVLFVNLFKLTRLRVKFVQLFKLVRQQLRTRGALLALLLVLGELAAALMPLAVVLRHKLSKRVLTRIAIKQGFLLFWFDELLMRVLTVDLDKQLAEFAELGEGTAVPLIKPRERPSLLITRRSKHSRPSSS